PKLLAGLRLQREQVRIDLPPFHSGRRVFALLLALSVPAHGDVALTDLQVELALVKQGARAEGPKEGERPDVLLPQFFAGDIVSQQVSIAVEKDDHFAVGGWRRRRKRAASVFLNALSEIVLPNDLAGAAIEAISRQRIGRHIGGRNEHAVAK